MLSHSESTERRNGEAAVVDDLPRRPDPKVVADIVQKSRVEARQRLARSLHGRKRGAA